RLAFLLRLACARLELFGGFTLLRLGLDDARLAFLLRLACARPELFGGLFTLLLLRLDDELAFLLRLGFDRLELGGLFAFLLLRFEDDRLARDLACFGGPSTAIAGGSPDPMPGPIESAAAASGLRVSPKRATITSRDAPAILRRPAHPIIRALCITKPPGARCRPPGGGAHWDCDPGELRPFLAFRRIIGRRPPRWAAGAIRIYNSSPMRAAVLTTQGQPVAANVELREWHDVEPGPGEVRVRTEASALNHLDLWVGRGVPGADLEFPRISGSDGCGIVDAVGEEVDAAWEGQRVVLNAAVMADAPPRPGVTPTSGVPAVIGEHSHGTMAARFLAPVRNVLAIGDADPVAAAAFALSHLTAWRMLVTRARLRAGQSVLIPGIGGGVALALLGIARHFGCHIIVTSRSPEKLARAQELGAHAGVLDAGEDFSREVRRLTGRRGVDVCADSVGKAIHGSCLRALARGGTFVTCGCTTGPDATTDLARIFWNQLSVLGSTMGDMAEFRAVTSLFSSGALSPVIDSCHTPDAAPAAYARLESGEHFGKVVIDWRSGAS
ncbi:MAG: zinc-binding dehydrogenase, partial [Phycisphaerales bacterium]|nr:zinc-binding dehydrogenase [Phycisphaerales bacterium]